MTYVDFDYFTMFFVKKRAIMKLFQVSINKVMLYLRAVFPGVQDVQLENCIACELHVTLTQVLQQHSMMIKDIVLWI